jgi:orotidine-5'-phosphate decarboxylase
MTAIKKDHSGRFTLEGISQALPDGKFTSHFVVTEHTSPEDLVTKEATGKVFDTAQQAEEAGLDAAVGWAEKYRPVAS